AQARLEAPDRAAVVEACDYFLDLAQQRSRLDHLRLVLVVEEVGRNDGPEWLVGGGPDSLEDVGELVAELGLGAGGIDGPHRQLPEAAADREERIVGHEDVPVLRAR